MTVQTVAAESGDLVHITPRDGGGVTILIQNPEGAETYLDLTEGDLTEIAEALDAAILGGGA